MVVKYTGTVTLGDIRGFSTVFLYNEIEAIFGHTTTTTGEEKDNNTKTKLEIKLQKWKSMKWMKSSKI